MKDSSISNIFISLIIFLPTFKTYIMQHVGTIKLLIVLHMYFISLFGCYRIYK